MSPTVFRERGYRFYFFSREETRKHVHGADGEAKFWLEPEIELAKNYGLSDQHLAKIEGLVEEHYDELTRAWDSFFRL
ncbi:MAG: DUF4160 domain-containing protein [Halioglobus sp.]